MLSACFRCDLGDCLQSSVSLFSAMAASKIFSPAIRKLFQLFWSFIRRRRRISVSCSRVSSWMCLQLHAQYCDLSKESLGKSDFSHFRCGCINISKYSWFPLTQINAYRRQAPWYIKLYRVQPFALPLFLPVGMLVNDSCGVGLVSLSAPIFRINLVEKYCIASRLSFVFHTFKSNAAGVWICAV